MLGINKKIKYHKSPENSEKEIKKYKSKNIYNHGYTGSYKQK